MMAPRATWSFKGCNSSHAYYKADQEAVLEHSSFDTPKLLMVSGVVHEAGEFGDVWEYSRSGVLILECSTCISAHPTILFVIAFWYWIVDNISRDKLSPCLAQPTIGPVGEHGLLVVPGPRGSMRL